MDFKKTALVLIVFISYFGSCLKKPLVGIAHHVSFIRPYGLFDTGAVTISNSLTVYPYIDSISKKLDFIGINYYGQVRGKHI